MTNVTKLIQASLKKDIMLRNDFNFSSLGILVSIINGNHSKVHTCSLNFDEKTILKV